MRKIHTQASILCIFACISRFAQIDSFELSDSVSIMNQSGVPLVTKEGLVQWIVGQIKSGRFVIGPMVCEKPREILRGVNTLPPNDQTVKLTT